MNRVFSDMSEPNEDKTMEAIERALKGLPPHLILDAKKSLQDFIKFSKAHRISEGKNPWSHGESMAFIAGYITGRGETIIKSN